MTWQETLWNVVKWMFPAQRLTVSGFCIMQLLKSVRERYILKIASFPLNGLFSAWLSCTRPWNYADLRWHTSQQRGYVDPTYPPPQNKPHNCSESKAMKGSKQTHRKMTEDACVHTDSKSCHPTIYVPAPVLISQRKA